MGSAIARGRVELGDRVVQLDQLGDRGVEAQRVHVGADGVDRAVQQARDLVVGLDRRRRRTRRCPRRRRCATAAAGSGACRRRRGSPTVVTRPSGPWTSRRARSVSAPYSSYISSGVTEFFRLLPILPNSRVTGWPSWKNSPSRSFDRRRVDVDAALVLVGSGLDVALVEQPGEGLLRRDVAEVEEHLVPEAGVQQVQHGVLDAADVEVDAAGMVGRLSVRGPIQYSSTAGSMNTCSLVRVEVAQVVPARTGPLRHDVGLAAVGLRSVAQVECDLDPVAEPVERALGVGDSSSASNVRGEKLSVSGSSTGSSSSGRVRVAVGVVDDRERLAPVALAAEQPVAQLVRDRRARRGRSPRASR